MYFIHVPETEKAEQQKVRATELENVVLNYFYGVNVQLCCKKVSTGEEIVEFASLAESKYGRL